MKKGSKMGGSGSGRPEMKKDRKSGTGMIGSPKKGGFGGKFTWVGDGGYELDRVDMEAIDAKDPNFQDDAVAP